MRAPKNLDIKYDGEQRESNIDASTAAVVESPTIPNVINEQKNGVSTRTNRRQGDIEGATQGSNVVISL